jgi:Asp-tRNA(Asn)/Glu-tRNA(Gln) amidotransferase C subunit
MAFGMNFFNKKEAPKKSQDTSIVEKAQEVAGNATDLSLKAAALAALITAGGHTMAAEKMDKDQIPVNKIEMSTQESTQKISENTISFEDARKMHQIDSLESVKDSLINKQEELQDQFTAKVFKFNTIIANVLDKQDKDTQHKFEDLQNLPELIQKYYTFINENRNNPHVDVVKAKEALSKMQTQMKDMTALMAQFSNLQTGDVFGSNSNDIGTHIEFNQLRKDMIALQEDLKKIKVQTGHEDELIAQLQSDFDSNQLIARK